MPAMFAEGNTFVWALKPRFMKEENNSQFLISSKKALKIKQKTNLKSVNRSDRDSVFFVWFSAMIWGSLPIVHIGHSKFPQFIQNQPKTLVKNAIISS